ncbi:hypothetical protein Rhopal_003534-T1 [Rhodotorula paludigena]|uniref:Sfi1 spindle body domain-containing protein n=1 Tax=Rhodotorula paludigena TaxID=86838 RepID=A0AAV5GJY4_9BASI|nr:hypothetical protein Rhopal_003534-T1 [Rhodotorula paludigena]
MRAWKERTERKRAVCAQWDVVAVEVCEEKVQAKAGQLLSWWVRRTSLRVREKEVLVAKDERLLCEAWDVWTERRRQAQHEAYLLSLAASHHSHLLASSTLSVWSARLSRLRALTTLSDARSASLTAQRASSLLTTWRLHTRLSLSHRATSHSLAHSALTSWRASHTHVSSTLPLRADALLARSSAKLRLAAFSAWADAASQRARLARAAQGVSRVRVLGQALGRWRARVGHEEVQRRKADVVRDFMGARRAWRTWVEKAWEARRERWEDGRRTARKKEALEFWIAQTMRRLRDRQLLDIAQKRQERRLVGATLEVWKSRVIVRKSLERDASDFFDRKAVAASFHQWTEQVHRAEDRVVLADEHRAVKLEELRDRAFHAWLHSTRRNLALSARLTTFSASRQDRAKELAFDKWRERSVHRFEAHITVQRVERERREAWEWWKARTKVWRIKTGAKKALKSLRYDSLCLAQ